MQWSALAVARLSAELKLSVALGQADCCAVLVLVSPCSAVCVLCVLCVVYVCFVCCVIIQAPRRVVFIWTVDQIHDIKYPIDSYILILLLFIEYICMSVPVPNHL